MSTKRTFVSHWHEHWENDKEFTVGYLKKCWEISFCALYNNWDIIWPTAPGKIYSIGFLTVYQLIIGVFDF